MPSRRSFLSQSILGAAAISTYSCAMTTCAQTMTTTTNLGSAKTPKLSLAQWSLNRAFFGGTLEPNDFARISKRDFDINAVEYVNQFYVKSAMDDSFWLEMKQKADDEGVLSLLIMVDDEGDLGDPVDDKRLQAVENHRKWINAAKLLDCHSIRVNAFGDGNKEITRAALIDGMGRLSEFAAKDGINVIIENHGLYSSDGQWIVGIMKEVNRPNFGTLPDFGNWCLNEKWGSTQNNKCSEVYDRYQGVLDFLPYAKGVSAKSYEFDAAGNETIIDYHKILKIVKDYGYDGHIGIEFEGEHMSEPEGIRATKELIEKVWASL